METKKPELVFSTDSMHTKINKWASEFNAQYKLNGFKDEGGTRKIRIIGKLFTLEEYCKSKFK